MKTNEAKEIARKYARLAWEAKGYVSRDEAIRCCWSHVQEELWNAITDDSDLPAAKAKAARKAFVEELKRLGVTNLPQGF